VKRPSPQLIAEWYGKLRREGFRDIEGGRDLNKLHASTFPGGDGTRGAAFVAWPDADFEPHAQLADHPTAVFHRRLSQAAWDLPRDHRDRRLVLLACEQDATTAGRTLGIHYRAARRRLVEFRESLGINSRMNRSRSATG
jgi:hypothetical protein